MIRIECDGRVVAARPGESVLSALLAAGIGVPNSCRAGACQACLVRAVRGAAPLAAQSGLKRELAAQGYFLACQAKAEHDLSLTLLGAGSEGVSAQVRSLEFLSADVARVAMSTQAPLAYRAGQFVNLRRSSDGLLRSYSLANVPRADGALELHVRVVPGGRMSSWLTSPAAIGAELSLSGPFGDCFYLPGRAEQPILLVGVGTGLAPLLGILHDALANEHRGSIRLLHGARTPQGLYLVEELRATARRHAHFEYAPRVLSGGGARVEEGALEDNLGAAAGALAGHRVFVCGDPELVARLRKKAFLLGAARVDIHADAFLRAAV